jgi:hypothetical protein
MQAKSAPGEAPLAPAKLDLYAARGQQVRVGAPDSSRELAAPEGLPGRSALRYSHVMADYNYFGVESKWAEIGKLIGAVLMIGTWTFGLGYLIWYMFIA